jgi:hypothetical protein
MIFNVRFEPSVHRTVDILHHIMILSISNMYEVFIQMSEMVQTDLDPHTLFE